MRVAQSTFLAAAALQAATEGGVDKVAGIRSTDIGAITVIEWHTRLAESKDTARQFTVRMRQVTVRVRHVTVHQRHSTVRMRQATVRVR